MKKGAEKEDLQPIPTISKRKGKNKQNNNMLGNLLEKY